MTDKIETGINLTPYLKKISNFYEELMTEIKENNSKVDLDFYENQTLSPIHFTLRIKELAWAFCEANKISLVINDLIDEVDSIDEICYRNSILNLSSDVIEEVNNELKRLWNLRKNIIK